MVREWIEQDGERVPVLTAAEKKAIAALRRLDAIWPRSLMLLSMGGTVYVADVDDHMIDGGIGVDPDKMFDSFGNIPNTGGDW